MFIAPLHRPSICFLVSYSCPSHIHSAAGSQWHGVRRFCLIEAIQFAWELIWSLLWGGIYLSIEADVLAGYLVVVQIQRAGEFHITTFTLVFYELSLRCCSVEVTARRALGCRPGLSTIVDSLGVIWMPSHGERYSSRLFEQRAHIHGHCLDV